jgi:predicted RNase H-like HicB family nuclease
LRELISGAVVLSYTELVEFDPEAKERSVTVPALPGCTAPDETLANAFSNVREAIEGHVVCLADPRPIAPAPRPPQPRRSPSSVHSLAQPKGRR